ncbi:hypothetical protein HOY82DRAFT_597043 [Tuber indicum]|nr:hypothetical protein HOY82DRAFT_597043 [Tuber indicum]
MGKTTARKLSERAQEITPIQDGETGGKRGGKGVVVGDNSDGRPAKSHFEVVIYVTKKLYRDSPAESGGQGPANNESSTEGKSSVLENEETPPAAKGPGGTAAGCAATRGAAARGLALEAPPTNQYSPDKKLTGYPGICKLTLAKSLGAPRTYPRNMGKTATTAAGKKSTLRRSTAPKKIRKAKRRDDSDFEYRPGEDSEDSDESCGAGAIGRRPKISRKKPAVGEILREPKTARSTAGKTRKVEIKSVKKEKVCKTSRKTPAKKVSAGQAREETGKSSSAKKVSMSLELEGEGRDNGLSKEPVKKDTLKQPASPMGCNGVRKRAKTSANSSAPGTEVDIKATAITSSGNGLEDGPLSQGQSVPKPSRPLRQPFWFGLEPEAVAGEFAHIQIAASLSFSNSAGAQISDNMKGCLANDVYPPKDMMSVVGESNLGVECSRKLLEENRRTNSSSTFWCLLVNPIGEAAKTHEMRNTAKYTKEVQKTGKYGLGETHKKPDAFKWLLLEYSGAKFYEKIKRSRQWDRD